MTIYRVAKRTWLVLLVLPSLIGGVLYVNRYDRPPSAAVQRLEAALAARPDVAPENNAFVHMLALGVPAEVDSVATGAVRYSWLIQQSARDGAMPEGFPDRIGRTSLAPSANHAALHAACKEIDRACVSALQREPALAAAWLQSQAWLLKRYRALIQAPAFRDIAEVRVELPVADFVVLREGQRLHLIDAWLNAHEGRTDAAARQLAADIVFWRRMQISAATLLPKMIAVAGMRRHFGWAAPVLGAAPEGRQLALIPAAWRDPVADAERDMLLSMAGEYLFMQREVRNMARDPGQSRLSNWLLGSRVFQPQDTINRRAGALVKLTDELRAPYDRLPTAALASPRSSSAEESLHHAIYNPIGKLIPNELGSFRTYGLRVADLEAVRRAALLAAQLRNENVPPAQVPQRIASASLRSPYTGAPFGWDAGKRALIVGTLQPAPDGPLTVPY